MPVKWKVSSDQLVPLGAQLPPCLIGMEAYFGAHHWGDRTFRVKSGALFQKAFVNQEFATTPVVQKGKMAEPCCRRLLRHCRYTCSTNDEAPAT